MTQKTTLICCMEMAKAMFMCMSMCMCVFIKAFRLSFNNT